MSNFSLWHKSFALRFLVPTLIFLVMSLAAAAILSLNDYRTIWLEARINAAHIASLPPAAPRAAHEHILKNIPAAALFIAEENIYIPNRALPRVTKTIHLNNGLLWPRLLDTAEILLFGGGAIVHVIGAPKSNPLRQIEIFINDRALSDNMRAYFYALLIRFLIISVIFTMFLFAIMHILLIHPLQKLCQNMYDFQNDPEDIRNVIVPQPHIKEIRNAESALADMQTGIRQTLHQKAHLAGLGLAVKKINHDFRNILSSAQLFAERLAASKDPIVHRIMPRLISSLNRAIDLCTYILEYGHGKTQAVHPRQIKLRALAEEAAQTASPSENKEIHWINQIPADLEIWADSQHVFRILLNLGRNAVQAMSSRGGHITFSAKCSDGLAYIRIQDDGPGLSLRARANLFTPFMGSTKPRGFGLGLPTARELARISGGNLSIEASQQGAAFLLILPLAPSQV